MSFPHFGPIHSVKRPTKARRVPRRPPSCHLAHAWGGRESFIRPGWDLTLFISYFPQLKIGSKLLHPWGAGRWEGGGSPDGPLATLTVGRPPWPTAGGPPIEMGWQQAHTSLYVAFGWRVGFGEGARVGHKY